MNLQEKTIHWLFTTLDRVSPSLNGNVSLSPYSRLPTPQKKLLSPLTPPTPRWFTLFHYTANANTFLT